MPYRMPAEWEPHEATWIAWPHERSDWPGKFEPIPWVYGEIVRYLSRAEQVRILIADEAAERRARKVLDKSGAKLDAVEFYRYATDRSWTRDYCPIFVYDGAGEVVALHWRFNGWAKYANHRRDAAIPPKVARKRKLPIIRPRHGTRHVVLEGGSIDVNGRGALLTTEECLLSDVQARNPGLSRQDLERIFAAYLGVSQIYWLKNGIAGDDTHGHIDDLARFINESTVALASEPDTGDANHAALRENAGLLRSTKLNVVKLPMPRPVFFDGQRLPASYANFYIANGHVLVPVFNDPADRIALNTLARCFRHREIIPIYCRDLALGLGTLHCMTQQEPSQSPRRRP